MNIWLWVQTWVDVDFLVVGILTKTTFPMAWFFIIVLNLLYHVKKEIFFKKNTFFKDMNV